MLYHTIKTMTLLKGRSLQTEDADQDKSLRTEMHPISASYSELTQPKRDN